MQVSDQNTFLKLIEKYLKGDASTEEVEVLESYYELFNEAPNASDRFSVSDLQKIEAGLKSGIESKIQSSENAVTGSIRKRITQQLWPRIAAAAAVLLVVGLSIFFYTSRHLEGSVATRDLSANDIKPGSNKAYLILSNGKRLSLNDAANGELAKEAGVEITKTADGQVIYTARGSVGDNDGANGDGIKYSNALNTIETPRGGQYQIRLPDGSKVWLNAASKLIYPVSFNGRGQRVVELSGEAYFEITKVTRLSPSGRDGQSPERVPFVVKSKNQEVTVLGTHFNVNSYSDEPSVKTTLLEGSVKVNDAVLKPGEQATLTNNQIKVTQVNTELAVAWKNNQFMFESERIENVMRMIARWYNVDIIYSGEMPTSKFGGAVSRFDNVSEVLKSLESTGKVHFRIEGQKIYVTK